MAHIAEYKSPLTKQDFVNRHDCMKQQMKKIKISSFKLFARKCFSGFSILNLSSFSHADCFYPPENKTPVPGGARAATTLTSLVNADATALGTTLGRPISVFSVKAEEPLWGRITTFLG